MEPSQSVVTDPRETKTLPVISEHIVSTKDTCGGARASQGAESVLRMSPSGTSIRD